MGEFACYNPVELFAIAQGVLHKMRIFSDPTQISDLYLYVEAGNGGLGKRTIY